MFSEEVLGKTNDAIRMLHEASIFFSNSFDELTREFKGTDLALRVGVRFLGGDLFEVQASLRSCETLRPESVSGLNSLAAAGETADA